MAQGREFSDITAKSKFAAAKPLRELKRDEWYLPASRNDIPTFTKLTLELVIPERCKAEWT